MNDIAKETLPDIQSRILTVRGVQVMLDRDLAELYGVEVKRLNEQVSRNMERFPERFMHQLSWDEFADLKSQIATSSPVKNQKAQVTATGWGGSEPPIQGVFYNGQIWDACSLVERLIASAQKSIVLIDSWVGPGTLDMLAKKRSGVSVEIVTSPRGNKLAATDIAKFNAQYPTLTVGTSRSFHDRFLILDERELYLIGASLKDLGVKCFAFTRLDSAEIVNLKARI